MTMAQTKSEQPAKQPLRDQSEAELQAQLDAVRRELWGHRAKLREGALQQNHQVGAARRQIARLLTALNERRRATQATKGKG